MLKHRNRWENIFNLFCTEVPPQFWLKKNFVILLNTHITMHGCHLVRKTTCLIRPLLVGPQSGRSTHVSPVASAVSNVYGLPDARWTERHEHGEFGNSSPLCQRCVCGRRCRDAVPAYCLPSCRSPGRNQASKLKYILWTYILLFCCPTSEEMKRRRVAKSGVLAR